MPNIQLIPVEEFQRVRGASVDRFAQLALVADMCRVNTLAAVKRAGSGHLGSSFSAMEIVTWLYYERMNTLHVGLESPQRDVYFSSKGHDVPGLYAVLYALGVLPEEKLLKLRRFGGLDGHPDVGIRGIEANSGSLGMGISKGRGIAWAKRHHGWGGHVYVMTGDGELQEGQIYESLQSTVQQGITALTVIVDHNKLQSDRPVSQIVDIGDLEMKFASFGWHVERCDGNDFHQFAAALESLAAVNDRPGILIADTIKGAGISFMEHPRALKDGNGLYRWHAGAPDDESFVAGHDELVTRINTGLEQAGLAALTLKPAPPPEGVAARVSLAGEPDSQVARVAAPKVSDEFVAAAYGEALVRAGQRRADLVVLDGDLSSDCRLRDFEHTFPERFIQNGIAEQDMVSMAGGLARHGLLPVVNTFANFLAARANEQIYNAASERTRIVFVCHYGGLIPAGPGKSHQSVRDISLFGAIPDCVILQPCNGAETQMALDWCVDEAPFCSMLRLIIGPSPRRIELPEHYVLQPGCGAVLHEGDDAVLFGYGPVMLHEALSAAEHLQRVGVRLKVVNLPWLNRIDVQWLADCVADRPVYVIEDHAPVGGLGDALLNALSASGLLNRPFHKLAVEGYPACGTPPEALQFHGLDGVSIAERIRAT